MPKYRVTFPVTVFVSTVVEADDAEQAKHADVDVGGLFYKNAQGGLSRDEDDNEISDIEYDNVDWNGVDVVEEE